MLISNPAGFRNIDAVYGDQLRVTFINCEDDVGQFRLPVFERDQPEW